VPYILTYLPVPVTELVLVSDVLLVIDFIVVHVVALFETPME
jgi:hypothetical protein